MALNGIDAVTFGVDNMTEAKRFLDDWGVKEIASDAFQLRYETRDGSEVIVRPVEDQSLPAGIEAGNTVREVIWGAENQQELDATLARLNATFPATKGSDGMTRVRDPNGMTLAFRVSRRRAVTVSATPVNAPGNPGRVNRPSPVHDRAHPIHIGHMVVFADDFQAMRKFYIDGLGFILSDEYPGHGVFLRPRPVGGHHSMFILNRPGKPGINHVAFTLSDIHEVIGGGLAMSRKGWSTEIGPGRHPISSAYFWYFHNPLCAPLEYYADEDFCTEEWKPSQFERKPELFAEWAIAGGIDGKTRRQMPIADKSGRGHA